MQEQPAVTPSRIKQFLQQYADDARAFALMQERLSTLEAKSGDARTSNLDALPRSAGDPVDSVGKIVSALDTLRAAAEDAEAQLAERRQRTETVIDLLRANRLPRWPEMTNVLNLRYIDGHGWPDVAEVMFGDATTYWEHSDTFQRKVFTLHRAALDRLAEITPADMLDDYA